MPKRPVGETIESSELDTFVAVDDEKLDPKKKARKPTGPLPLPLPLPFHYEELVKQFSLLNATGGFLQAKGVLVTHSRLEGMIPISNPTSNPNPHPNPNRRHGTHHLIGITMSDGCSCAPCAESNSS